MTFKIREHIKDPETYEIYILGMGDRHLSATVSKEELEQIAQDFNNEVAPIIGEENLYERD